jgi:hypothetical protein
LAPVEGGKWWRKGIKRLNIVKNCVYMHISIVMIPFVTIPWIWGEGDKGKQWKGWIQLWYRWYIVRTFVNATIHTHTHTLYNNKVKRKKERRKERREEGRKERKKERDKEKEHFRYPCSCHFSKISNITLLTYNAMSWILNVNQALLTIKYSLYT